MEAVSLAECTRGRGFRVAAVGGRLHAVLTVLAWPLRLFQLQAATTAAQRG